MFFKKNKDFKIKHFMKKAKKYGQFESKAFEELVAYCEANTNKVIHKKFGVKLIVISDTHGEPDFGEKFETFMESIPEYDLCIILGDIYCCELERIIKIVPVNKIIALRGNHDSFDIYKRYGIWNINGNIYSYKGVKFAGIEGSFRYKKEEFPSYTHYESLVLAQEIPQNADVLLTHDCMFTSAKNNIVHAGLAGITYYIYNNNVQWHIHGHIHKSYQSNYSNGCVEKSVYGCEYIEI